MPCHASEELDFSERVHNDAGTGTCRQFRYPQGIAKPGPVSNIGRHGACRQGGLMYLPVPHVLG